MMVNWADVGFVGRVPLVRVITALGPFTVKNWLRLILVAVTEEFHDQGAEETVQFVV